MNLFGTKDYLHAEDQEICNISVFELLQFESRETFNWSCFATLPYPSSTVGPYKPNLTKMTSQISWLLIGGEHLRKIFGKSSENGSF